MFNTILRPLTRILARPRVAPPSRRANPFERPGLGLGLASSLFFSTTTRALALARKPTKIKLKTHKGAAKRWTAIANGQFKRGKVGRVHLNSNGNMSPTRLNRLGQTAYARTIERKLLRRLLPYA
ncbi:hypothetical protein JCM3766R1_002596 [Sporobolomyces carnicolor]